MPSNKAVSVIKSFYVSRRDFFKNCCLTLNIPSFLPSLKLTNEEKRLLNQVFVRKFPSRDVKIQVLNSGVGIARKCILEWDGIETSKIPLFHILTWGEEKTKYILSLIKQDRANYLIDRLGNSDRYSLVGYNCIEGTYTIFDDLNQKTYKNLKISCWCNHWDLFVEQNFCEHEKEKRRSLRRGDKFSQVKIDTFQRKLNFLCSSFVVQAYNRNESLVKTLFKKKYSIYIPLNFFQGRFDKTNKEEKRDFLIRSIIAQIRYKSLIPVIRTDQNYKQYVLRKTKGKIESYGHFPSLRHNDKNFKFRCVRCGTVFSKFCKNLFDHLKCPNCDIANSKKYSKQAIEWLNDLEKRFSITIQTAESPGGEYRIELGTSKYHYVDGYCKDYNIVFEYHGSRWHGNPTTYYMDDNPNPYNSKITSFELLKRTMILEKKITQLGYAFVRIWDSDFLDKERYRQWIVQNTKRIRKAING